MKKILILICFLVFGLTSCEDHPKSYTAKTLKQYNKMSAPVILISKAEDNVGSYMVTLLDGEGDVYHFTSMSTFANSLGQSYKVGDTIKQPQH